MAVMHPRAFPHDLKKKPRLKGEALVFDALAAALPNANYASNGWEVFYDRPVPGSRRRVDFVAAHVDRGLLAIEVKGGLVHDKRGAFRQLISKTGRRKRIDPFGQLKLALRDLFTAAGVVADGVPVHQAIWFPEMGQAGLRWSPSPHILTHEQLDKARLRLLVEASLSSSLSASQSAGISRVIAVFQGRNL